MFVSFLYIWDGKSEVYFRIVGEDDSCKPSIETKTSRVLLWSSIDDHHRHSCFFLLKFTTGRFDCLAFMACRLRLSHLFYISSNL